MIKVAVITSGGDGSGINAAIEILARDEQIDLYGFHNSFDGIMTGEPIRLTQKYCESHSLDGKQLVKTARSQLLYKEADRKKIHSKIIEYGFEFLVICGGDGSKQAAKLMNSEGTKTLFIPMTIDNDIGGTDYSIGFDTALNNILRIIHDLHDTAHNLPGRIFMVEVLGGNCGNLALNSAIAGACDLAIVPEYSTDKSKIVELVNRKLEKKNSIILVCSESAYEEKDYKVGEQGVSFEIAKYIEKETDIRVRKTVMGFYMRSGTASYRDAMMASLMGELARECIHNNKSGLMMGVVDGKVQAIPIDTSMVAETKKLDADLVNLAIRNELIIQ